MRSDSVPIGSGQHGFTLLEVLIAVVIFTIGILSVNAMQIASIGGNAVASRVTESTSWASDRIESLLSLDYTDAALTDNDGDGAGGLTDVDANADGSAVSPDGRYSIFWNVSEDSPFLGVKTVTVITTTLEKGITKTVTMTYMKADAI
ncbi:MAG: type IV pilus modification PilV family protein [Thermodesulfobacteriota bacterium]